MFCANCGKELQEAAAFCQSCGAKVGGAVGKSDLAKFDGKLVRKVGNWKTFDYPIGYAPKNRLKAFLLCLFLGFWGVHHFYVGKKLDGFFRCVLFFFFFLLSTLDYTASLPRALVLGTSVNTNILLVLGCLVLWAVDIARIHNGTFTDKNGFPLCYPEEEEYPEEYAPKNKTTVLLLCIFMSWLALHRFYIGRVKSGAAMCIMGLITTATFVFLIGSPYYSRNLIILFIFCFPISLVWWIIDLINICSNEFKDKKGYPLKRTATRGGTA